MQLSRTSSFLSGTALLMITAWCGWQVRVQRPFTPESSFGYALGVAGGLMMLYLLFYPLRKRSKLLSKAGALKHWFRLHMICGVGGPACILFHATLTTSSINATVAFVCMLIVALSGVVGRFLYGRIHHGLRGRRASVDDMREHFEALRAELEPKLERTPALRAYLDDFAERALSVPEQAGTRLAYLLLARVRRARASRTARRLMYAAIESGPQPDIGRAGLSPEELRQAALAVDQTFEAVQRAATFSTWERLFALWHVAHVPFVYLFVVTSVAHVVAVHIY